jgi:hypothetical protein
MATTAKAEALLSQREATLVDAGRRDVEAEEREWEAVLGDGID